MEEIILVNKEGFQIGIAEKFDAHKKGLLHRAFSVFIFNNKGELLIQKRASEKYHSPNLWSNACCGHPRPNESTKEAAMRRLNEEMGFSVELEERFTYSYYVNFENGLVENEFDHIFIGYWNNNPLLNLNEASEWKYIPLNKLQLDLIENPLNYTFWFKEIIKEKQFQTILNEIKND